MVSPSYSFRQNLVQDAFLVLDIGTKIIKAVLFSIENARGIKIIGYGKEIQKLRDFTKDVGKLVDLCRVAIFRAKRKARIKKIKGVILGFGGGLIKSETFCQEFLREDSQKLVDAPEFKNILQKLQWRAKEEICRRPEESAICPPKLLKAQISEVRIDGFQVINPFDFQGKKIAISVFNSYTSPIFLSFLEEFSHLLKLKILEIFDENFAVFQVISRKNLPNFDAILVDIGGTSTQVSLIRKGKFEKSIEFGIGGQNFTDQLSKIFGVTEIELEDIKVKYSQEELGYGVRKKIASSFEPYSRLWFKAFNLALEQLPFKDYLPSKIFLFGGSSLLPEIKEGLLRKKAQSEIPFLVNFKTEILIPAHFGELIAGLENLENPQDTVPLALACYFALIPKEENIFERILKQTLRIIQ